MKPSKLKLKNLSLSTGFNYLQVQPKPLKQSNILSIKWQIWYVEIERDENPNQEAMQKNKH